MEADQVERDLDSMLETVPHAAGVNNHQGSRATADAKLMGELMPALRRRGLFFVDSRTTAATVAYDAAERAGVRLASRKVFLDDTTNRDAILSQIDLAARDATRDGFAIAIGHPHPATIAALVEQLHVSKLVACDLCSSLRLLSELCIACFKINVQWHCSILSDDLWQTDQSLLFDAGIDLLFLLSALCAFGCFPFFDGSDSIGARKERLTLASWCLIEKIAVAHQRQLESDGRMAVPLIENAEANRDDLSVVICFGGTQFPHSQ